MRVVPLAVLTAASALIPAWPPAWAQSGGERPPQHAPVIIPGPGPDGADPVEPMTFQVPDAQAACDGEVVTPAYSEILPAREGMRLAGPDLVLAFATAPDGRVTDLRPVGAPPATEAKLQAAFAAWRFEPRARADCRLTVTWRTVALAEAEIPDLLNYFAVDRRTGRLRDAVARRLGGDGADCGERWGGRRPAVAAYPDFLRGRRPPPGGSSWTVVRWNIAADGQASKVEILGSSGDADLDAEGLRAVSETRMRPGPARTGCVYNFYRTGETLPAPPMPAQEDRPDPLAACPEAMDERFRVRPRLVFPEVFRQRAIEGWALVRFDVAPWGAIGNAAVIEAQPAALFGEDALRLVRASQATPGFEAGVRCVVPVRYRIEAGDDTSAPD